MPTETILTRRDLISRGALTAGTAGALASLPAGAAAALLQAAGESAAPTRPDPVTVGVVGTGNQGQTDLRALLKVPGVRVAAVCDIYPPNLQAGLKLAGEGAQGYAEYRKMLERKDLDAVVIATPLYLHAPMALDALDAGKHVLVEKMMAYSVDEGKRMIRAVERTGRFIQVGHQRRYSPLYHHAVEQARKGTIGRLTYVRAQWHRNGSWRRALPNNDKSLESLFNWRLYWKYSQGLMAELGSHQIDVVNWFTGSYPTTVTGIGGIDYWRDGREVWDSVSVVFSYANGVKFQYSSICANAYEDYYERLLGDEGTLVLSGEKRGEFYQEARAKELDWMKFAGKEKGAGGRTAVVLDPSATTKTDKRGRGEGVQLAAAPGVGDDYYLEMADFIDCVRTGRKPYADVYVGMRTAVAAIKANEAMRRGTTLKLDESLYAA
jgi:predicted dehydrogenase